MENTIEISEIRAERRDTTGALDPSLSFIPELA